VKYLILHTHARTRTQFVSKVSKLTSYGRY